MEASKAVMDDSLSKTKEIVNAVQVLQKQQDDADRKANKELRAHADARQKIKAIETEHAQTKEAIESEWENHVLTKERLEKERRYHAKTLDALQASKDDVASMLLQMDAMKVEMEAQRKAFVINVNWAARCTELKTNFDQSCNEYDQLFDKQLKAKSAMDSALRGQGDLAMKHQADLDEVAIVQDEVAKQVWELASKAQLSPDVVAHLAELEEFQAKVAQEAIQKKLGSQQSLAVMQRGMAKGDEGLKMSAFSGWASLTVSERKKRIQKDKVMQRMLKNIASGGMALCATVFKEWHIEVDRTKRAELLAATKRLEASNAGGGAMASREKLLKQFEKNFAGQAAFLVKTCFQGWANGQIARKKLEQNHKKATRMIGNSGKALCAEIFGGWNELTEKTRAKNRDHEGNLKRAGRFMANSSKQLQIEVFQGWWGMIEDIRNERKGKEAGTAKAMRMMANSAGALLNLMFDSWATLRGESKKKDAGNKKALRMMAGGNQALTIAVWEGWSKSMATRKSKDAGNAKAARMMNGSNQAIVAASWQAWSQDFLNNRDKNKKMQMLEKTFGAQDQGLKVIVLTAWQHIAQVEGRTKRAKEQSMKSAVKNITGNQDLLLAHLTLVWARWASFNRMEKLQGATIAMDLQLQEAVEQARVAVEVDLAKAQSDSDRITSEINTVMKERDDENVRLEGLEGRLEDTAFGIEDYNRKIDGLGKELEQSRCKAKDIGDELAKLGVYIASHSPRKNSRGGGSGGSDSRPRSGTKKSEETLPSIVGSTSRPHSGSKANDGSKSARGVAGERGGSGRRDGRPPAGAGLPRTPPAEERRYLNDGSGPYSQAEFLEIYAVRSREQALSGWTSGMPEMQAPAPTNDAS